MIGWLAVLLGGAAAVVQARSLRRAADVGPRPAAMFARLLLVGTALCLATAAGQLAAGVAGWGIGLAVSVVVLGGRPR